jgi:hypothetical protein
VTPGGAGKPIHRSQELPQVLSEARPSDLGEKMDDSMNDSETTAGGVTGPPAKIAPTSPGERIEIVDVLRGFAIFGILAVNMLFFANPFLLMFAEQQPWPSPIDQVTR